jgi:6-phosphogluconolactonase (cycloisomerase 2 family)
MQAASHHCASRLMTGIMLVCMALLTACGGGSSGGVPTPTPTPTPAPSLQSIAVSPQSGTVAAGLTQQFTATGAFSDGSSRPITNVTWSSSDTTIATIDSTGLAKTLKQGAINVSAASGAIAREAPFTVGPPVPTGLIISPPGGSIVAGSGATKFSALLTLTDNTTADVSGQSTWTNTNSFVATVDSTGNVTSSQNGLTTISASNGAFSAKADVAVITVPRYLYFTTETGRLMSRANIDATTGRLRMTGYIPTSANNFSVFPCSTTDPSAKFLYVGSTVNSGTLTGEIQIYSIDNLTGTLSPLIGSPFPIASGLDCIEFEPSGNFGFAANGVNSSTQLLTFLRDSVAGTVALQTTTNLGGVPTRPAIDPLGKYLYLAAFGSGFTTASALGFSIDPVTGSLTPISGTPFTLPNTSGNFSFHPSGSFAYMANTGATSIDFYSIDRATGRLTTVGSIATCVNPTTVRFSPDGKLAYSACSMDAAHDPASASVESFSVGANGALSHIGSTPSADAPFDLNMDTSGKFLYLSANSSYVYSFQIGADGIARFARRIGIQPNQGFTMAAVGGTLGVKYTPKFAYVSTTGDDQLTPYAVIADGTLGALKSITTQLSPFSLSLWPWQSDLLVASAAPNPNVTSYELSSATGAPVATSNFGNSTTAGGVAVDPSGQFAFETDSTKAVVSTFKKSGTSWGLVTYTTPSGPETTFNAGAGAGPIAIDSAGRFVYVANQGANSISAYQYFGGSPELFEATGSFVLPFTDGSPFAIGAQPLALTVAPNEEFLYVLCGDQTLRVFAIDYFSGGHIAQLSSTLLLGPLAGIATEPTGRFIYVADSTGVNAFSVNTQTGTLTKIPLSPAITPVNINGVYVEPSGKTLYVTTSSTMAGSILGFTINGDGTLTALAGNPLATPNQPSSMVFSADIQ